MPENHRNNTFFPVRDISRGNFPDRGAYGATQKNVVASAEIKQKILKIGINKCARESGFDRKNFIRKLIRGIPVKRNSYNEFVRWLEGRKNVNE